MREEKKKYGKNRHWEFISFGLFKPEFSNSPVKLSFKFFTYNLQGIYNSVTRPLSLLSTLLCNDNICWLQVRSSPMHVAPFQALLRFPRLRYTRLVDLLYVMDDFHASRIDTSRSFHKGIINL